MNGNEIINALANYYRIPYGDMERILGRIADEAMGVEGDEWVKRRAWSWEVER